MGICKRGKIAAGLAAEVSDDAHIPFAAQVLHCVWDMDGWAKAPDAISGELILAFLTDGRLQTTEEKQYGK